jgi:Hemerythrin HHE cation binding domain
MMRRDADGDPAAAELLADHRRVEELLDRLARARRWRRPDLYAELRRAIIAHETVEQSVVYPAVTHVVLECPPIDPRDVPPPLVRQEHRIEELIAGFPDAGRGRVRFRTAVRELSSAVRQHLRDEEATVVPLLTRLAQPDVGEQLAADIRRAREHAPTRPHPHAPSMPPLSLPVLPVIGRADRAVEGLSYLRHGLQIGGGLWLLLVVFPRFVAPVATVIALLLLDRIDRRWGGASPPGPAHPAFR